MSAAAPLPLSPRWLGFVTLIGVLAVVLSGFREDGYLTHVRQVPYAQQPYPLGFIAAIVAAMTFEAAMIGAIVHWRAASLSWRRPLLAMPVAFAFLALVFVSSMHMPPAWFAYLGWTMLVFVLASGLTLVRVGKALAGRSA
jgi:hypothetical protein